MPNLFSKATTTQDPEKEQHRAEEGLSFYQGDNPNAKGLDGKNNSGENVSVTLEMLEHHTSKIKIHFKEENEKMKRSLEEKYERKMDELEALVKTKRESTNEAISSVVLDFRSLQEDTYTLMMISSKGFFWHWFLGLLVFISQLGLGILTIYSQLQTSKSDFNDTFLQIPIRTRTEVSILQVFSIFIVVYSQEDVFNAIALLIDSRHIPMERLSVDSVTTPRDDDNKDTSKETSFEDDDERAANKHYVGSWRLSYLVQILLPNIFKFLQGISVLIASFIVILQSTDVIELLKDFTALFVISSIDDIIFSISRRGFFGTRLLQLTVAAENLDLSVEDDEITEARDNEAKKGRCNGFVFKTSLLHSILLFLVTFWAIVFYFQSGGFFAKQKYPKCEDAVPSFKTDWKLLENEVFYPGCSVEDIYLLGNGECNGPPYDSKDCRFDGGDCSIEAVIKAKYPLCEDAAPSFAANWSFVENDVCDMVFNIPQCGMDGGDCTNFNLFYPDCKDVKDAVMIDTTKIGNGVCDGYPYNFNACNFDGGDCREDYIYCDTNRSGIVGDKRCDQDLNVWQCLYDRGDCEDTYYPFEQRIGDGICDDWLDGWHQSGDCIHPGFEGCMFNGQYPNFIDEIRDGKCHNDEMHNREECGWDGGDCIQFNKKYPNCKDDFNKDHPRADAWRLGDGVCDVAFITFECGFDEGDCCIEATKNNVCELKFNTIECGWDKGDCIEFNRNYPDCIVDEIYTSKIGDNDCDNEYNTEKCGFDGGDCIEFNSKYPNCTVAFPYLIGDGKCDGGAYNTEECGWDGGDCIEFNTKYCNCDVQTPYLIRDGKCDGEEYNTEECGWDGGDCLDFNEMYPNCTVDFPYWIGDGQCKAGSYNTEECGWDGGDCLDFNEMYPNCDVDFPYWIGDGQCDGGAYNTEECGWDGGDCLDFNEMYPNCTVHLPYRIGDGQCRAGSYNTEECGWDGGDCLDFNEKYPNCDVVFPFLIGDGQCSPGSYNTEEYNTEECGWDGGDCLDFNEKYPNCTVDFPFLIGDDTCDGEEYNTEECGWDGGDCI
ncbi:hypothetical protein CTEN210_12956 [Chaetoceros tenuissimus]|uniref:LNR domain-containing protein n=1 Tax=Chaetoceros tenuissimus TaxID=426638 RepID=A0AAD3HAK3_9STRA|nr:hypothetical protein CTEN210_12956 [Chaetoceros tenuissimus]